MQECFCDNQIPERIDLHMHTSVSDGTDDPRKILDKVVQNGLQMFSVTDHDAMDGAVEISRILQEENRDILFVKGIEFSCQDTHGKYHILGYDYDETAEGFANAVQKAHNLRLSKVNDRLAFLKDKFGMTFREEDIRDLFRNSNPGKPHIAKMMIRYGYASSIKDAMDHYLNKKKFPNAYLSPEEAIHAILAGGGIPVLAHPSYGDGGQLIIGEEMDRRLKKLISYGLEGVECYYSGFTPKLIVEMLDLADRYDLYVTAGSDYHGSNKLVGLGETNLPSVAEGSVRIVRFIERVMEQGHI